VMFPPAVHIVSLFGQVHAHNRHANTVNSSSTCSLRASTRMASTVRASIISSMVTGGSPTN